MKAFMQRELTYSPKFLETLIVDIPKISSEHSPYCKTYLLLQKIAKTAVEFLFSEESLQERSFSPFGQLSFPYTTMGAIDSLDLFGLDELIIFSLYWFHRESYKNTLDIGANLGLHSIIMEKCGFTVTAFEPDPLHFEKMQANLSANHCTKIKAIRAAISNKKGEANFVRVLGNTTSSHLQGAKIPYGNLETFKVPIENIEEYIADIDLMKMDAEGHEAEILLAIDKSHWKHLDAILEIGSNENAKQIYTYLQKHTIPSFSQKNGWQKVVALEDMPVSYRDGSLFISKNRAPFR